MRVIDHKKREAERKHHARKKTRKIRATALFGLVIVVLCGVLFFGQKKTHAPSKDPSIKNSVTERPKKGTLKQFTPQEFRDLYNNFAYPNTELISEKTSITGNEALDDRIRTIAKDRGYTLRSAPVTDAFREVEPGMKLQERAAKPWLDLQTAAKNDGVTMNLSAAYRSASEQKDIFLSRFVPRNATPSQVAAGIFDSQIVSTLQMTAVPGYSRHHTGYTIDIMCDNNIYAVFTNTSCYQWLSKNNYENAKKRGWIPSYPEGTGQQGPEPEGWEYVWVGIDALTE